MTHPLVMVDWVDSLGCGSSWSAVKDVSLDRWLCRSVGWLVGETEHTILVVPHMHDGDEDRSVVESGMGDMLIPRCAVVRLTHLEQPEPINPIKTEPINE